jgi:hypothetical protein
VFTTETRRPMPWGDDAGNMSFWRNPHDMCGVYVAGQTANNSISCGSNVRVSLA